MPREWPPGSPATRGARSRHGPRACLRRRLGDALRAVASNGPSRSPERSPRRFLGVERVELGQVEVPQVENPCAGAPVGQAPPRGDAPALGALSLLFGLLLLFGESLAGRDARAAVLAQTPADREPTLTHAPLSRTLPAHGRVRWNDREALHPVMIRPRERRLRENAASPGNGRVCPFRPSYVERLRSGRRG